MGKVFLLILVLFLLYPLCDNPTDSHNTLSAEITIEQPDGENILCLVYNNGNIEINSFEIILSLYPRDTTHTCLINPVIIKRSVLENNIIITSGDSFVKTYYLHNDIKIPEINICGECYWVVFLSGYNLN